MAYTVRDRPNSDYLVLKTKLKIESIICQVFTRC